MNLMLEPTTIADLLLDVPFLTPLSAEQRLALAEEAQIGTYQTGTNIVTEGEFGDTFYIIYDGMVTVYKQMRDEQVEVGNRSAGTFFGEMALIQRKQRSATVRAATDVVLIEINRDGFDNVILQGRDIMLQVLKEVTHRLRMTDQQMIDHLLQKNEELRQAYARIEHSYDATLVALSKALDLRDTVTEGHSLRVAEIAVRIGQYLGLSDRQLQVLRRGALLHDIGKIGIPDRILHKKDELSQGEWKLMQQHPRWGREILEHIEFLCDALAVVRYHHEAWDGSGYPSGLEGEEIPLLARIFSVADTYDAITQHRPYRRARRPEVAQQIIREQANQQFDPQVVEAFEAVFPQLQCAS